MKLQISQLYGQLGERSRKSLANIFLSFGAKGVSLITQLLIVPLTINYVNATQYGIWLTLSSIIAWIGFFDFGFGNGMRNKVAEALAKGDNELARQYVSTTYFAVGVIVLGLFLIVQVLNFFINWSTVINVDATYTEELRTVFSILTLFFCLNLVVKLFNSLLTADQKPGVASWIDAIGQVLSLAVIFLLTKISDGSLIRLAAYYSGIPTLVILLVSAYAFRLTTYKQFAPRLKYVRKELIRNIMSIGIQFFIIYLCMLVIFQVINLVISRELGPEAVTEFNIAHRYFSIAYSVMIMVVTPFWTAFTDAYHRNDFVWMKKAKKMLEIVWLCEVAAVVIMLAIAPWFYRIWVGDQVLVGSVISAGMALYVLIQSVGAVYMYLINGIGTIRIQLMVYVFFAIVSWPLMVYLSRKLGLVGVIVVPTLVYLTQAILGKIQIEKLLSGTNSGIWVK